MDSANLDILIKQWKVWENVSMIPIFSFEVGEVLFKIFSICIIVPGMVFNAQKIPNKWALNGAFHILTCFSSEMAVSVRMG